jgi:hypothetical protein
MKVCVLVWCDTQEHNLGLERIAQMGCTSPSFLGMDRGLFNGNVLAAAIIYFQFIHKDV